MSFYFQERISEVHGKELTAWNHDNERKAAQTRWASAIFTSLIQHSFLCKQQKLTDHKRERAAPQPF